SRRCSEGDALASPASGPTSRTSAGEPALGRIRRRRATGSLTSPLSRGLSFVATCGGIVPCSKNAGHEAILSSGVDSIESFAGASGAVGENDDRARPSLTSSLTQPTLVVELREAPAAGRHRACGMAPRFAAVALGRLRAR